MAKQSRLTCISLPTSVICALITFDTQQKISVFTDTEGSNIAFIYVDTQQKVVSSTTLGCDLLSNIALITFDIQRFMQYTKRNLVVICFQTLLLLPLIHNNICSCASAVLVVICFQTLLLLPLIHN